MGGASGAIAALVNMYVNPSPCISFSSAFSPSVVCRRADGSAPKAHVALYKAFNQGDYKRAKQLQDVLADGDLAMQKLGVAGLKFIVKTYYGYGNGLARSPLPGANEEAFNGQKEVLDKLMDLEFSL